GAPAAAMKGSPSRENCRPTELYGQAVTDDRGQPKPLEPACRRLVRCARRLKESPARPAPTVPCPNPAAQQSHCRSLPAGDCLGVHAAGKNRRQGRLLQYPAQPPQRTEAAVGACLQAIASAGTPPERIAGKASSYSALPKP